MSSTIRATGASLLHATNSPVLRLASAGPAPLPAPMPNLAPAKTMKLSPSAFASTAIVPTVDLAALKASLNAQAAGARARAGAAAAADASTDDGATSQALLPVDGTSAINGAGFAPSQPSGGVSLKWIVGGIAVTGVIAAGIAVVLASSSKKKKRR